MNRLEQIQYLIGVLLKEMPVYQTQAKDFPRDEQSQRRLLRSLMNVRPPLPLDVEFLAVQDELLLAEREEKGVVDAAALPVSASDSRLILWQGDITRLSVDAIVNAANSALLGCFVPCHGCIDNAIHSAAEDELLLAEREEKGVVDAAALPVSASDSRLILWQGDITRLSVDAIVNAANSALLGCFVPCHGCIDNAIHSAAGLQLRDACNRLMEQQGHPEPTGQAKLTAGYNLPARYVLHTVGPIVQGRVSRHDRELLASCYRSCLELAAEHDLQSVAFCCISTGEFHFPNQEAAKIAVQTVKEFLQAPTSIRKVIFNVFKDFDADVYRTLL